MWYKTRERMEKKLAQLREERRNELFRDLWKFFLYNKKLNLTGSESEKLANDLLDTFDVRKK